MIPVSQVYWQAKIWGLLHDPALKALHFNTGRGLNSFWQELTVMQEWKDNKWNPEESEGKVLKHIHLADYITSASDRAAIGSLSESVNYAPHSNPQQGLEIIHLLSGETLKNWQLPPNHHQELIRQSNRADHLNSIERSLFPDEIIQEANIKKVFWWLWRCLPTAVCRYFGDESLLLMPAETRIPDGSIWSHVSLTAAMAGALAGYDLTSEEIKRWPAKKACSHPYLATFSFTPVQELIKASRKMRDFWAGSWILHYLSAKVSWKLAQIYGPDSLVYPCLFHQPLIDYWLLEKWNEFSKWIAPPSDRQLLTAGFPNVLVLVLPKDQVQKALQTAKQTLKEEWRELGKQVFNYLQYGEKKPWMSGLDINITTWQGWLDAQWQTYWSALPIGDINHELKSSEIYKQDSEENRSWRNAQNSLSNLRDKQALFVEQELDFLQVAAELRKQKQNRYPFSANVGSWWPYIFDQTRFALNGVKNARTWEIPTAFGDRSTVSGLGPVVHPDDYQGKKDWITEGETKKLWQRKAGLFDGIEKLNATETLKRGLHKILPQLFDLSDDKIAASYPDLTAGVAGYLKNSSLEHRCYFEKACEAISQFNWIQSATADMKGKWGIPWADSRPQKYHPRLLNAGWLVEETETEAREKLRTEVQTVIDKFYPSNNPADWYVIAAGDGDGMSEWLKGQHLANYSDYIPQELRDRLHEPVDNTAKFAELENEVRQQFQNFLQQQKRMGPSTHSALSRALLDFSNQLVPYLTEERYAGRLIYGGGDDVLAYTNLWEWDKWLWDIRQCFRGSKDPHNEFANDGDYWRWNQGELPKNLTSRPLFTMGSTATISFGIVIAHHSVPLAIALENLWEAEEKAKEHKSPDDQLKDAVQVRVLYGNGNILKSTAKFDVFNQWKMLLNISTNLESSSSIFEQAAEIWEQHPAPVIDAIAPWTKAFCDRRDIFKNDESARKEFQEFLADFLQALSSTTEENQCDNQIQSWLKLAAFVLRNRTIKI